MTPGTPSPADALLRGAGLDCVVCRGSLTLLPDFYPLAFHCEKGHFLTLTDLLDAFLSHGFATAGSTMECWQSKAVLLREFSARALKNGHTFMAADLQEAAQRVDNWVGKLRTLLAKREASTLSGN